MAVFPPPRSPLNALPSPGSAARNSFNVERMVVHNVKEVKGWGDPRPPARPPADDEFAGWLLVHWRPDHQYGLFARTGRRVRRMAPRSTQDDGIKPRQTTRGCSKIETRKI